MFGFPTMMSLPFMMGSALPPDDAASLALRAMRGAKAKSAIKGFVDGMPQPGKELGADLPSTQELADRAGQWLKEHLPASSPNGATPPPTMPGGGSPMNPMPAISPWPMQANGANPSNPSLLAPPVLNTDAGATAPGAATSGPSSSPGGSTSTPPNMYDPLYSPMLGSSSTGGFNPVSTAPAATMDMSARSGPGSASFGASDSQSPGLGLGSLMNMFNGGPQTSNPFGSGLMGQLSTVPSQLGGLFGTSQFGPTFADGASGMMGGVAFPIF